MQSPQNVAYKRDLDGVDWDEMKSTLQKDDFDNGRTPVQLKSSFEKSYSTCIAYINKRIIGTARVLSDGICNAYVVDVWTLSAYRRQGIARTMMQLLLDELQGQHVYLFTDDAVDFYKKLGFTERPVGMEVVVGTWLVNEWSTS
jgi:ribosomal protein S18 acetylase RimI-like enzyme